MATTILRSQYAVRSVIKELGYNQNMPDHIAFLEQINDASSLNPRFMRNIYSDTLRHWKTYEPDQVRTFVEDLSPERNQLREYLIRRLGL